MKFIKLKYIGIDNLPLNFLNVEEWEINININRIVAFSGLRDNNSGDKKNQEKYFWIKTMDNHTYFISDKYYQNFVIYMKPLNKILL